MGSSPGVASNPHVSRVAALVRRNGDRILSEWALAAGALPSAAKLERHELVDHVPPMLHRIAELAESLASGATVSPPRDLAGVHARERLENG
jgi:hypothetical protein